MGCAASNNTTAVVETPSIVYDMVVVDKFQSGRKGDDRLPLVDIYSLECFSLKHSLVKPNQMNDDKLQIEFSTLLHATKPEIYLIETATEGKVWHVNFAEEEYTSEPLPTFPNMDKCIFSCLCCSCDQTALYAFMTDCGCYFLSMEADSETSEWQLIQSLPIDINDVTAVYTVENRIAFLTDKLELICLQPPGQYLEQTWHELFREPIPPGIHSLVGKYLYSLSEEESALFRIDLTNADFSRVMFTDVDVDIDILEKSTSMTGTEDVLYFSGYHYSTEKITIMEVDMGKKRCTVVGYLDYISPDHQILLLPS